MPERGLLPISTCHVENKHRLAAFRAHDHIANIGHRFDDADGAHDERLISPAQYATARIGAVAGQCLRHLIQRDAVAFELVGVDLDLVLLDGSTKTVDVGNAGHHAQCRSNHPILYRPDIVFRHAGRGLDDVAKHFADGGGQRRQRGLHTWRQVDIAQVFEHLGAGEVAVGAVFEGQGHDRQAGHRHGAQLGLVRDAAHLAFDRQGQRALDFLGRGTGALRDDLHLDVLHVGKSLDRQMRHGADAKAGQREGHDQHEHWLGQDEANEFSQHGS